MSQLKIVLIDVAWGDSIFLEAIDNQQNEYYALIDSNDTTNYKSSLIFLRKYFQRKFGHSRITKPLFNWVMLSHAHLDHGQGLKEIMRTFGTSNFYYPKSVDSSSLAHLQQYANRVGINHQAIDSNRDFPNFGDVNVNVLWPPEDTISNNENDNSIVLSMNLHNKTCMLTGDAEEAVWNVINPMIPNDTVFFKVPHHGSRNGSLDNHLQGTWTAHCPNNALLAMSTHNRPFNHPHQEVLEWFTNNNFSYARTDNNYHLEYIIDNNGIRSKYSNW
jgi:beta-lactamase superfamily II metal-dependent hydrolase